MAVKLDEVTARLMGSMRLHVDVGQPLLVADVVRRLLELFDALPILVPERFDPFQPVRTKYTREAFVGLLRSELATRSLMVRGRNLSYYLHRSSSDREVWFWDFDLNAIAPTVAADAADRIVSGPVTIAALHAVSRQERSYCESLHLGWPNADGYRFSGFGRHQLAFGLPTLAWRTYFGPMYIRHFGKERLLSAPSYSVEEVHADFISIQLTESIQTLEADWNRFHATRQAVVAHLGAESFQRARGPGDPPPMGEADRNGVPGSAIPQELLPLRHKLEADYIRERRPMPDAVSSLEDLLTEPTRFRVVQLKGSKGHPNMVVVDVAREEMIGFADEALRDLYVRQLLAAGAEFKQIG